MSSRIHVHFLDAAAQRAVLEAWNRASPATRTKYNEISVKCDREYNGVTLALGLNVPRLVAISAAARGSGDTTYMSTQHDLFKPSPEQEYDVFFKLESLGPNIPPETDTDTANGSEVSEARKELFKTLRWNMTGQVDGGDLGGGGSGRSDPGRGPGGPFLPRKGNEYDAPGVGTTGNKRAASAAAANASRAAAAGKQPEAQTPAAAPPAAAASTPEPQTFVVKVGPEMYSRHVIECHLNSRNEGS